MSREAESTRRVLRRCPQCRLLFESVAGVDHCIVCGVPVEGLALPLGGAPTTEIEREPTSPLTVEPEG